MGAIDGRRLVPIGIQQPPPGVLQTGANVIPQSVHKSRTSTPVAGTVPLLAVRAVMWLATPTMAGSWLRLIKLPQCSGGSHGSWPVCAIETVLAKTREKQTDA